MPIVTAKRKWYRLHASTWVVALLAAGVLVLLVVPGVLARRNLPYAYELAVHQNGWPWPFLEQVWFHDYEEKVPWLLGRAWQFESAEGRRFEGVAADVDWGLLAADAACALGIMVGVIAAWEWRRRRRERSWHLTLSEMLLATLAVACGLGWWQMNVREAARQEGVAFALMSDHGSGGRFEFRGPAWLYRLTGQRPAWLQRRAETDISFSAEAVRSIATLKDLEELFCIWKDGRLPAGNWRLYRTFLA